MRNFTSSCDTHQFKVVVNRNGMTAMELWEFKDENERQPSIRLHTHQLTPSEACELRRVLEG